MIYLYTILVLLVASGLGFTISYLYFIRRIREYPGSYSFSILNFAKVYRGYVDIRKKAGKKPGNLFYLHFVSVVVPITILFLVSWVVLGTPSVKKGSQYLISNKNDTYIFVVNRIQSEKGENILLESIDYSLYQIGEKNTDTLTSSIKYRRTKENENSYHLERIEGTTKIVRGTIAFTWSYRSDCSIYLYLDNGTTLKKCKTG